MARRQKARETPKSTEDELLKAFGRKVREARERAGLTRAQLGDATGLAPSYLFEIENEGANVTLKTLAKLAESLKLGPRDLLPESEQDALTGSAVAELIAALDRAADVLVAASVSGGGADLAFGSAHPLSNDPRASCCGDQEGLVVGRQRGELERAFR